MAMHLVQVIPHDDPGGMQQVARDLHRSLPPRGITSSLLNLRSWVRGNSDVARVASELPTTKPRRARAWLKLATTWRTCPPDAVLAHTVLSAVYTLTAARVAGVSRRIVIVHGNQQTVGSIRARMLTGLARLGFVTDLVFVGHAAAQSFGEIQGPQRCIVIQNGISVPHSEIELLDVDPKVAHLICAGRLVEGKNVDTAIRAAAKATAPTLLHIFGDGTLRATLEDLAVELSAPAIFHGAVTQQDLWSWYAAGTALLFPTFGEGLPLTLIEAAASGLPIIASERSFNREVMGGAAIYCDPTDELAWSNAVDAVAQDSDIRDRMRAEGQLRTVHFSIDRMADDYAVLLHGGV